MDIFKIEKSKLKQFLDDLSKKYSVFVPAKQDRVTSFKEITLNSQLSTLNSYNTDKPPKDIFFPQTETLFTYDENSQLSTLNSQLSKPIAIFGVRPCDAKSFTLLDKVFDSEKYTDTYWKERYKDALVFALGCNNPLSTCFCNWVGGGPFNKEGADISLIDIGEAFLAEPCSKKGEEVIHKLSLQKATEDDLKKGNQLKNEAESMLSKPVEISSLKEDLDALWNSPKWEEIARKCLNCAACTYLCPTCHCFDIQDEGKSSKGKRIRIWDSCMFKLFTQEAAGTNPRPTGKERMRQRIMHKFNYLVETIGEFGCVGCGRCIISCPVNLDVREVIKEIKKVRN
ncbi:4Fe-4S dicluster domain-containing protein [candidate division WOR-3 bacterium]|nr:4Fe-4S dicluster domain-containing protein [candidate division WOR-3 bacterium]